MACIAAGVKISGTNAEVTQGQWEFQIGPCEMMECADHLWIARYLLQRLSENFDVEVTFDPKLIENMNGSGVHLNFSTLEMREDGGIKYINEAIERLAQNHHKDIVNYDLNKGEGNRKRLTGIHETSSYDVFSSGVGDRSVSVRIPREVAKQGRGYLEDRRPASDVDPYLLLSTVVQSLFF